MLIAALPEIINGIITFLLDSIPQIIETGIQLLTSLVAALPDIIMAIVEAIPKIIEGIITAVLNAIPWQGLDGPRHLYPAGKAVGGLQCEGHPDKHHLHREHALPEGIL